MPLAPAGYELIRELGSGGMGTVYLAREFATERLVAMKYLQRPGNAVAFERFLVEVKALAGLDHPHIVRVLSSDFLRADPFFTTEYLPGGSLARKVESDGPFDPLEAARLMATAARAIHAANTAKVIHRDLKPSNILVAEDGMPRIADFGLAKRLDRDDGLTTSPGPLGTPRYMAPEQTGQDKADIDARTDVYGLGATLYFLLTGQPPFNGTTDESIRQIQNDPPRPPRSIRKEIPRELEAIVLKCLEKDPARRYPTAEALALDLERFVAGQVPEAPLLTWRRRAEQRLRRQGRRIGALLAVVILMTGIFALGASFWPRPSASGPPDPQRLIGDELRAGRSVNLVGKTGLPLWHRWGIGAAALGASTAGDDSCYFHAVQQSLLELVPDLGIDRYQVTGDVRLMFAGAMIDLENKKESQGEPGSLIGIYFGYAAPLSRDGVPVHFMFTTTFNDNLPPQLKAAKISKAAVQARTCYIVIRPNSPPTERTRSLSKAIKFTPADKLPGEWRRLRVTVTPDGVKLFWGSHPGEEMVQIAELSAGQLNAAYRSMAIELDAKHPGLAVTTPTWHPGMPVGICSRAASVTFRNVVIEPLP